MSFSKLFPIVNDDNPNKHVLINPAHVVKLNLDQAEKIGEVVLSDGSAYQLDQEQVQRLLSLFDSQ